MGRSRAGRTVTRCLVLAPVIVCCSLTGNAPAAGHTPASWLASVHGTAKVLRASLRAFESCPAPDAAHPARGLACMTRRDGEIAGDLSFLIVLTETLRSAVPAPCRAVAKRIARAAAPVAALSASFAREPPASPTARNRRRATIARGTSSTVTIAAAARC